MSNEDERNNFVFKFVIENFPISFVSDIVKNNSNLSPLNDALVVYVPLFKNFNAPIPCESQTNSFLSSN